MLALCTLRARFRRFSDHYRGLTAGATVAHIGRMKPPRRLICGKPVVPRHAIAKPEPCSAEMEAAHRRAMAFMSETEDEWRERHKGQLIVH
jgi:hypothetical protein